MTEFEQFAHELKQYLNLGAEKRIAYGRNFYKGYFMQAEELGETKEVATKNMERLVAYTSASDGEINRSEYEFCNCALFTKDANEFLQMCRENMRPEQTAILQDVAKKHFKAYGHKSYMFIIALFIVAANGEATKDEQKKMCSLFGLLD